MKYIKPTIALLAVALAAALVVGLAYTATHAPIARQRAEGEMAAVIALLPGTHETREYTITGDTSLTRRAVALDARGRIIGHIFYAEPMGYAGRIYLMAALDTYGTVQGIHILRHTETPGLGANITQTWFTGAFAGAAGTLTASRSPETASEIPLIASATISVNAVLRAVNDALAYFERMPPS